MADPVTTGHCPADLEWDDLGRLLSEVRCRHCGYLLRGLLPSQVCPECGSDVTDSLVRDRLCPQRLAWLQRLSRGNWCVLNWLHVVMLTGVITCYASGPVPGMLELAALGGGLGLLGFWLFTAAPADADELLSRSGHVARWAMMTAILFWWLEVIAFGRDRVLRMEMGVFFRIAAIIGLVGLRSFVEDLMRVLSHFGLAVQMRRFVRLAVVFFILGVLVRVLLIVPLPQNGVLLPCGLEFASHVEPLIGLVVILRADGIIRRFRRYNRDLRKEASILREGGHTGR